jgi:prevent-host-death family protein
MKKILPVTDFQRQAGQILSDIAATNEEVIITQRGRPAAVLLSAAHYSQLEEDMERLDELEPIEMVRRSREDMAEGRTISHQQVKTRRKS